jgi:membrane protein implicated in regulation of membrane protease activity
MTWWLWIFFGLALLITELFIPTQFFIFLVGIGAILTGLLVALGLGGPPWLHWLMVVAISSVLLVFVRRFMLGRTEDDGREVDRGPQGEVVEISDEIAPGGTGSAQLRGSNWMVRNAGQEILRPGDRCPVDRVDGISLVVSRRA